MAKLLTVPAGPFVGTKILCHLDRLNELLKGQNPAPIGMEIDLTNNCNLACPHCTNINLLGEDHLGWEVVRDTLDQASRLGVLAVVFTGGGEPTTSSILELALEQTLTLGMEAALITNGVVEPSQKLLDLVSRLTWLRISLDASNPTTYSQAHGVPEKVFEKVVSNIRRYVVAKSDCTVGVGFLTTKENEYQFEEASRLVSSFGVDYLQFRPVTYLPADQRRDGAGLSELGIRNLEAAQIYTKENYSVYASVPKYEDLGKENFGRTYKKCWGAYFAATLGATGDLYVCCHMRGTRFIIGNVNTTPFDRLWRDFERREEIYNSINIEQDCMSCCRFHKHNLEVQKIVDTCKASKHPNYL